MSIEHENYNWSFFNRLLNEETTDETQIFQAEAMRISTLENKRLPMGGSLNGDSSNADGSGKFNHLMVPDKHRWLVEMEAGLGADILYLCRSHATFAEVLTEVLTNCYEINIWYLQRRYSLVSL